MTTWSCELTEEDTDLLCNRDNMIESPEVGIYAVAGTQLLVLLLSTPTNVGLNGCSVGICQGYCKGSMVTVFNVAF